MISIQTRYIGPTNYRSARVKAFTENKDQSVTISWDDALGVKGNHDAAARALIIKLGWACYTWHGGGAPDKRGEVYVRVGPASELFFTASDVKASDRNAAEILAR
jgi:hypothetical protein